MKSIITEVIYNRYIRGFSALMCLPGDRVDLEQYQIWMREE